MAAPATAARPDRGPDDLLRAYAAAGFRLFPLHSAPGGRCSCGKADCHSPGKHPRTDNGVHDASADPGQLTAWATRWPACNWGLALDGLVAIDIDPRNGGDAMREVIEAKHGKFPDTCIQQTGGGGVHLLYRARDGVNYPGTLGSGIDVKRGAGSYICIEPSIHASGQPYLWIDGSEPHLTPPAPAPEWIGQAGGDRQAQADTGATITVTPEVLKDLESALTAFDPDNYDDWIRVAHALKTMGPQGFALWDTWARKSSKHDDGNRDPAKVWADVRPQWSNYKSIFATAQKRGWENPKAKAKREQAEQRAATARADDPRPLVQIVPGERHIALDQIDAIMANTGDTFQRSGRVVHVSHRATKVHGIAVPEHVAHIVDATSKWIAHRVGRLSRVERRNRDGDWKLADISDELGAYYVALTEWQLPTLRGIAAVPVLLPDGRVISTRGYNTDTGLWVDWRGGELTVPDNVTRADALAALRRVSQLVETFPFVNPALDGTVAIAALMAGGLRPAMAKCPAFAFGSPSPGSGKTTLAKVIAHVAMGGPPLPLTFGHSEEEFQKAIATAVLLAAPVTLIDNINAADLNSPTLAVAISEGGASIRRFNTLEAIPVECPSLFLLTGNALWVSDDLLRRVLMCDLDPGMEHPEFRTFPTNPEAIARDNRAQLLTDMHIIVRGFAQSGVVIDSPPIAGFPDFCRLVRDPLIWLGQPDLTDKMKLVKAANPKRLSEVQLLDELRREFGDKWMTAGEIMQRIEPTRGPTDHSNPDLRAIVEELTGKANSRSLGRLLQRTANRILGQYRLRSRSTSGDRGNRYQVEEVTVDDGGQRGFDV